MTDAPNNPGTHQSMLFFGEGVSIDGFDPEDFPVGLVDGLDVDCAVD